MDIIDSNDPQIQRMRRIRRKNRVATVAAMIVLIVTAGVGLLLVGSLAPTHSYGFGLGRRLLLPIGAIASAAAVGTYRLLESKEDPFDDGES